MLRPRIEQVTLRVRVDGVDQVVEAWSDMSALEALRTVVPSAPSKCEAGICRTCEVYLDGVVERVCSLPAHRLDGASVETRR